MGNSKRYILINDSPATHVNNVLVEDLKSGKNWNIDGDSIERYKLLCVNIDDPMIISIGKGFSPDDKKILLKTGLSSGSFGMAEPPPYRSYVVDLQSGKILKEYKTDKIPNHWWVDQN